MDHANNWQVSISQHLFGMRLPARRPALHLRSAYLEHCHILSDAKWAIAPQRQYLRQVTPYEHSREV